MIALSRHLSALSARRAPGSTPPAASRPRATRTPATRGATTSAPPAERRLRERVAAPRPGGGYKAASSAVGASICYRVRPSAKGGARGAIRDFLDKLQLAWQVFFPDKPPPPSPKGAAKQRLRMILVADRCGLSPLGLAEMKRNILRALEEFVDIESEEEVDVSISIQPDLGTIYCVAVPVRRVKPGARLGRGGGGVGRDGGGAEWDPEDRDSDPSGRFPMGC